MLKIMQIKSINQIFEDMMINFLVLTSHLNFPTNFVQKISTKYWNLIKSWNFKWLYLQTLFLKMHNSSIVIIKYSFQISIGISLD